VQRYEQTVTKLNDSYLQRAKKNWAKDGDRNTAYFHRSIAKRGRKNSIFSIKDEQNLTHFMPDKIAEVFISYFKSIFTTSKPGSSSTHFTDTGEPPSDNPTYAKPDKQEIWQVLNDMKRNASPGPDGFNVEFYLATWDWIGDEVHKLVVDFFNSGLLPDRANATHIALVLKKLVTTVPTDFRPISLCNMI
jgi:hypothetical protein